MTLKSFFSCFHKETTEKPDEDTSTNMTWTAQTSPDASTSALIESILPLILPIVSRAISKQLIQDGSVLYEEQPLTSTSNNSNSTSDENTLLPIGTIGVTIGNVCVMDHSTIQRDVISHPEFHWPEKEKAHLFPEWMKNVPGIGRKMIVLDLVELDCLIPLNKGMELSFPAELPFNSKAKIEIGCGGDVKEAWVRLEIPRVRIWFISRTMKLYLAIMERPRLTPNLHVNADRGKGDFMNLVLREDGNLDDVVETILSGFGPRQKKGKEVRTGAGTSGSASTSASGSASTSWIGNAVGKKISQMVREAMGGEADEHRPLEIDLSDTIKSSIDTVMGKARSVDAVKADIAILEKELVLAIAAEKEGALSSSGSGSDAPGTTEDGPEDGGDASKALFCGLA